jgi:pantoate kinase
MKTYTEEITLNEGTVEVTFTYYAGRPGTREEPPEPEEIEIEKVMYEGVDVTPILGHEAFSTIETILMEAHDKSNEEAEDWDKELDSWETD